MVRKLREEFTSPGPVGGLHHPIPSLLNNCGLWIGIKDETIKKLDALQNMCVLTLLKMPLSNTKR